MKKPVVIIPGYYGSKLSDVKTGDMVWLDWDGIWNPKTTMRQLRLDEGTGDKLKPAGIIDEIQLLPFISPDVYKPLIKFLRNKLKREVHSFSYDWRKSLDESADLLHEKIEQWRGKSGAANLDIVAHSFGGLVARAYLQKYGQAAIDTVDWLITIGSPHKGMLKTFRALTEGITLSPNFKRPEIRETARTLPSAYELIPYAAADGMFYWGGEKHDAFARDEWCETQEMAEHLGEANRAVTELLPAEIPVKTCMIYGTHVEKTDTRVEGGPGTKLEFKESDDGDGTVPRVSARGDGVAAPAGLFKYPIPFGHHNVLYDEKPVKDLLTDVLQRGAPPDVHFTSHFRSEKFYRPRQKNRLVVEFRDGLGSVFPGADVQLKLIRPRTQTIPVPQTPNGDHVLDMWMPGPGPNSFLRGEVIASAPGLAEPLRENVFLAAAV